MGVEDFMRALYKEDLLSIAEFNALKQKLVKLQNGELVPNEATVRQAISS